MRRMTRDKFLAPVPDSFRTEVLKHIREAPPGINIEAIVAETAAQFRATVTEDLDDTAHHWQIKTFVLIAAGNLLRKVRNEQDATA